MEAIHALVQANGIAVSGTILLVAYIFIATEKIPKVTVALIGATITLLLGLLSQNLTVNGIFQKTFFINYIDFNVIFLLVSMMIIVGISSKSGMFTWVANELMRLTKGHPKKAFFALALFTAFASAFLDNVTTVILVMPVTFVIAKELDVDCIPFLITEILASNIGGTATLIGDPPNIIIGSAAGFSFMQFITELTGVVVVILLTVVTMMLIAFRKKLTTTPEKMAHVANLDNSHTITDKNLMIRSLVTLILVIAGFVMHDALHLKACVIAMAGASFLLLFEKPQQILREVEWNTIFFFIGLFIIIGGFEASGGISMLAKGLLAITHGSQSATAMIILWASGILSGIIDNIPYTATMAPMLVEIEHVMGAEYTHPLWWCLSLGACLGGNLTIIGAAANVIVSETASASGHHISFMRFMKYGALATLVSLVISTIYINLRFLIH